MKNLSNTEAELKKSVAYKKACSLNYWQIVLVLRNGVTWDKPSVKLKNISKVKIFKPRKNL